MLCLLYLLCLPGRFFRDRQRINVAMSRARHLSVVVCHRPTLQLPRALPWSSVLAGYAGMASGSSSGSSLSFDSSSGSSSEDEGGSDSWVVDTKPAHQAPASAARVLRVTRSMATAGASLGRRQWA